MAAKERRRRGPVWNGQQVRALRQHPGLTQEQMDEIVTDYYKELGWDAETGVPTQETIKALELEPDAVTV